jgi:YgiT-type zinc finger domain-containing protein
MEDLKMKCTNCGGVLVKHLSSHKYIESGLKNIVLANIPVYRCSSCAETELEIPCTEELHLLIAFILMLKPFGLTGDEGRYLRKHMGYTAEDLAGKIGVTRVTVARWESGKGNIKLDHDKQLRRLYLDKKGSELNKLPAVYKILNTLIDFLPAKNKKSEFKIHTEDWITCGN